MPRAEDDRRGVELLLERLLGDPAFRADFRRDPAGTCGSLGLVRMAGALGRRAPALQTLEVRESRSPLAGAVAAAAVEVIGAIDAVPAPAPAGSAGAAPLDAAPPPAPGEAAGALASGPPPAGASGAVEGAPAPAGANGAVEGAPQAVEAPPGVDGPPPTVGSDERRAALYRRGTFPVVTEYRPDPGVPPAPAGGQAAEAGIAPAPAAPVTAPPPAAFPAPLPDAAPPVARFTLGGTPAPAPRATLGGVAAAGAHSTLGGGIPLSSFELGGAASPTAQAAVVEAEAMLGTPYVWGGAAPGGFDCSGLLQWAYAQAGVAIPRVAADQAAAGVAVPDPRLLEPGDIVYFENGGGPIEHVGMYVGGGRFLHAPHSGEVVKVSSFEEASYRERYAGARRIGPAPAAWGAGPPAVPASPRPTLGGLAAAGGPPSATLGRLGVVSGRSGSTLGGLPAAPADEAALAGLGAPLAIDPIAFPYPGDAAPPEAIASWMAAAAAARGLPPELPVMVSLSETNLQNLPYGDRDSLGLFQQRPSQGWGTPAEIMDPYHSLGIFLDRAAATDVGARFSALGPAGLGDWAQAVQISGFPERFEQQLPRAQALLAGPVG